MPIHCPHCGAALPDAGDVFCPICRRTIDTLPEFLRAGPKTGPSPEPADSQAGSNSKASSTRLRGWLSLAACAFIILTVQDTGGKFMAAILFILGLVYLGEAERLERRARNPPGKSRQKKDPKANG